MKFSLSILIFSLCLIGCTTQPATSATPVQPATAANPSTPTSAAAAGVLFQVVKPDGSAVPISVDDLKKMPLGQLMVDGKPQEGPKLLDVLAKAGIQDFKEVSFEGSSSPATLTRAQVNDQTLLDYANRGTVKLAAQALPKEQWTKDITRIVVK